MDRSHRVLVGIPAYNAQRSLLDVIARTQRQSIDAIVVVDDGSTDQTAALLESATHVETIRHGHNRGYGAAQKSILDFFRDWSISGQDILAFMHADGEIRPEDLPVITAPFGQDPSVDVVFGSRVLMQRLSSRSRHHVSRPVWKRALDSLATLGQNAAYGAKLSTYFGGFRALRRSALHRIDYHACDDRHFFDQELLIRIVLERVRLLEVPVCNVENNAVSNYRLARNALSIATCALSYACLGHLPHRPHEHE